MRYRLGLAGCILLSLAFTAWIYRPLPLHLGTHHTISQFGDSLVWNYKEIANRISSGTILSTWTTSAGYPYRMDARFLAWIPSLLALPFQALLGPVGAYNLILLLTPALSGAAAYVFLRRISGGTAMGCGSGALIYALSPYMLSVLANGQTEKAQLYVYPLYLLFFLSAVDGPRRGIGLAGVLLIAFGAVFTAPYFGLFIPLLAGTMLVVRLIRAPDGRHVRLGFGVLALLLTALGLAPSKFYFQPEGPPRISVFQTSSPIRKDAWRARITHPPYAQPRETFLEAGVDDPNPVHSHHVTYLGRFLWPLLFSLFFLRFPARWEALALFLCGLITAFGPRLLIDGVPQSYHGHPYYLPMEILERLGYPLKRGGQYYRAIPIASLGIALTFAGLSARSRSRSLSTALVVLSFLGIWEGSRSLGALLPRPVEEVPGRRLMASLASDVEDGAVLDLPIGGTETLGGAQLLASTLHRRPTTALARHTRVRALCVYNEWLRQWMENPPRSSAEAANRLRAIGFRYIIHRRPREADAEPVPGLTPAALQAWFGPPRREAGVSVWDLGPTRPKVLEPRALPPPGGTPLSP